MPKLAKVRLDDGSIESSSNSRVPSRVLVIPARLGDSRYYVSFEKACSLCARGLALWHLGRSQIREKVRLGTPRGELREWRKTPSVDPLDGLTKTHASVSTMQLVSVGRSVGREADRSQNGPLGRQHVTPRQHKSNAKRRVKLGHSHQ